MPPYMVGYHIPTETEAHMFNSKDCGSIISHIESNKIRQVRGNKILWQCPSSYNMVLYIRYCAHFTHLDIIIWNIHVNGDSQEGPHLKFIELIINVILYIYICVYLCNVTSLTKIIKKWERERGKTKSFTIVQSNNVYMEMLMLYVPTICTLYNIYPQLRKHQNAVYTDEMAIHIIYTNAHIIQFILHYIVPYHLHKHYHMICKFARTSMYFLDCVAILKSLFSFVAWLFCYGKEPHWI